MRNYLRVAVAVLALVALPAAAQAEFITGSISFAGCAEPESGGSDWQTSTGAEICGPVFVSADSGDYEPVGALEDLILTPVTFLDFSWGGSTGTGLNEANSVPSLWSFTYLGVTYSFDLEVIDSITRPDGFINVTGFGTAYITGFDPTPGEFKFTGTGSETSFGFTASNSSTGGPDVVPEPGSMFLLGTGLMGLAGAARRRRNQKKTSN